MEKTWIAHVWPVALTALVVGLQPGTVLAEDVFNGTTAREFPANTLLPADSTIGGYAVFQGDGNWRVISNQGGTQSNFGVTYGTLRLLQYEKGVFFAEMATTANVSQSSRGFYVSTNFCAGEHLVKAEIITPLGSEGTSENCLTIDPYVATLGKNQLTTLWIKVTNTQSAGRFYQISLFLNPELLGFPGTAAADWSQAPLAANPDRKQFVDRLAAWGKQLQGAVKTAIDFSKPRDAFKGVPSWRTLAADTKEPFRTTRLETAQVSTDLE